MKAHAFRRLLGLIVTLSVEQLAHLKWQLTAGDEARAVLAIIEGRVQAQTRCPRCDDGGPVSQRVLLSASAIAPATLARRRSAGGRLSPVESDRVYRIADCLADAIRFFEGGRDAARGWLMEPARALGGAMPFEYLTTEVGASEVRRLIGRLEHGVYA